MAKEMWNLTTKKITASAGAGVLGYYMLQPTLTFLPELPEWVVNPIIGQISLLTLAGAACIYAVWFLWKEI